MIDMEAVGSTQLATSEVVESTKLATVEVKGTPFDIEAVEGKTMEAVESDPPEVPKPKLKPVKNKRLEELSFPLYQESIALLEKHVYHSKKRGPVEFVEKRTINLRIKERHPSFNMVYKRVATWLRQVKQYKGEFYNGVKGYWLGTDGGLLAPLKPKATPPSPSKAKRARLASVPFKQPAPKAFGSEKTPEPPPSKPVQRVLCSVPEPDALASGLKPLKKKRTRLKAMPPVSTEIGVTGQLFQ